ncbi:MAG: YfhO family protein, partial [Ruminococcus sp.]|nr:YfhO family protein [Ruminococcus sp.]
TAKYRRITLIMNVAVMVCFTVVSVIKIYESGSNFVSVSKLESGGMPVSEGVGYAKNVEKNVRVGNEWRSGDDDFYRCEAHSGFTFNPSMLGDFHGMGYYSSTMQGSVFELLRYLGNRVYAENVSSIYNITSPVQNGLFGIKYILDYNHNFGYYTPNSQLIHESSEVNVWENPTSLPIAYSVTNTMKDFDITNQIRMIQNQNDFLNAICGRDVNAFSKLETTGFSMENTTLQESEDWNTNYFIRSDQNMPVKFYYTYTIPQDGCYYVEHNFRAGTINAVWQNESKDIPVGGERGTYMGRLTEGTVINITAEINDVGIGCVGLNMYYFDENAWQQAFDQLNSESLDVTKFKSTSITGKIHKESDGLVMATIPQDGGWKAYCDGEKLDTIKIADTFVAFNVPAGDHDIILKYSVPGLASGFAVTVFGLILLLVLSFPEFFKKYLPFRKKVAAITVKDTSENAADETEGEEQTEEDISENPSVNKNSKKKMDNGKKK